MRWFKHFSNAHNDNALNKVRMRYGADGYAIYWYCLELIAGDLEGENASFELSHDAEVIGFNLKIDQLRVEEIMRYMIDLKLFEQSGSKITCLKMAKFLDKKYTRNIEIHKIIDSFNENKSHNELPEVVADKLGQTETFPARRDEMRGEENIKTNTLHDDEQEKNTIALSCPCDELVALYHKHLPNNPKCKILNPKRKAIIKARWNEAAKLTVKPFGYQTKADGLNAWDMFFEICAESLWLTGRVKPKDGERVYFADIDFIFSSSGFVKIIENKYHREAV